MVFFILTKITRKSKNSSNNSKKSARSARDDESYEAAANTKHPKNLVWKHYQQGKEMSTGYWQAICKYCNAHWGKEVIYKMENYLVSHCLQVPHDILRYYINLVEEKDNEPEIEKKRKLNSGIQSKITNSFKKSQIDDPAQEKNITHALLTKINKKIHEELLHKDNLTLVLDRWSSAKNRSLWNFIILTPQRKEYLYYLSDFTDYSHTGEFLARKIDNILNKVDPEKFSAICSDNASNVKLARSIIVKKYPNIIDMRCISHCFNLISCDIMEHSFAFKLIAKVNIIIKFFKNSHVAAKLTEMIKERNIEGGGLKTYCKTHWTTVYNSIASVLRLKSILEYITASIKFLPSNFNANFRQHCLKVIDIQFEDFDNDAYTLTYMLYSKYHGAGLKNSLFIQLLHTIANFGYNMGYSKKECKHLCRQLKGYKEKLSPFNISYDDDYETPDLYLKSLAKMSSYYLSNLKKELVYYGQNVSTEEIVDVIHLLDVSEIEEMDKDSNFKDLNIINDKSNDNVEVIIE
ncbi:ribonuclease H-like domain-containing protein [Rhizophagus clarus]|uniref:Ribonuclease H-like domain-containing protein n=1 Tax=Rhizophagus clarus TaxID=94130 RepID=A0A8H3LNV7_9GLOM|nr:ribonuclease H-like domain-containing protein [Rhizophagus clarus]